MLHIFNVLRKTLVVEYYRLNVGFLFLIAMFAFGILRPEDHIALAAYIFANPLLLSLMFGLWALYHLKITYFVRQRLLWDSHEFLYFLRLLPPFQRMLAWLYVQWMLWLPVMMYAGFVGKYAWSFGQQKAVLATALYLFLMPFLGIWAYEHRLVRPNPDTRIKAWSQYLNRRFAKPYWSFFLLYLFKQNPVLLLLTKVFTCGVVVAVCKLYPTDTYDERLLSLGALTVGMGHSFMLLHLYEFEHLQLLTLRNFPFTLWQRFGQYSALFGLLLLPEVIFFVRYFPQGVHWMYGLGWLALTMALLWMVFGRFQQKHYLMDTLLRHGFYAFIAVFFAVMFKTPVLILAGTVLGLGVYWFWRFYYTAEYIVHEDALRLRPE